MSNGAPLPTVNDEIYACLDLDKPKSFFLFAGAGSGKTRSLVEVLTKFKENNISRLRKHAQKVAIITYTKAARDEIISRLNFDSSFQVSTIHSFAWELIHPYTPDIRVWLSNSLEADINDLADKQARARSTETAAYIERDRKIASKTKRLESLPKIRKFSYSPDSGNAGRDSLNHSEVVAIAADFLQSKSLLQNILVRKFPILLIDESQDTNKELIEAFFTVQAHKADCFSLGMFGDTMQRIYADGKKDLGENIPESWVKPEKIYNYRCPKRVLKLINKVRLDADRQQQEPGKEEEGILRLFIVNTNQPVNKGSVEAEAATAMADYAKDLKWNIPSALKTLTLEHHMAAARGQFQRFFNALYSVDKYKTSLLDGTLSGVALFINQVLPLIKAKCAGDEFAACGLIRKYSPLLKKDVIKISTQPLENIKNASQAVSNLFALWNDGADPKLCNILENIQISGLFNIPEVLVPIARRLVQKEDVSEDADQDPIIIAWEEALQSPFSQFKEYVKYISDESQFGTHQGIKGLEFPRVMVILDDEEARGFLFSYEKLFGAAAPSETDTRNQAEGNETSIDRSRRLFYVTCSRAKESLAIIAYTKDPVKVKAHVIGQGWFDESEVIEI